MTAPISGQFSWDRDLQTVGWEDHPASAWTDVHTEKLLEVELGYRTLTWLQDVDPYEYLDPEEILAMIPQHPSLLMEVT